MSAQGQPATGMSRSERANARATEQLLARIEEAFRDRHERLASIVARHLDGHRSDDIEAITEARAALRDYVFDADERAAACPHDWHLVVLVNRGGARMYQRQCFRCFHHESQWVKKSDLAPEDIARAFPRVEPDRERIAKARQSVWDELSGLLENYLLLAFQEEDRQFRLEYDEYIRSPEWANRRALVLARAAGLCEGCRQQPAVEVHHLNYHTFRDELLFDLVGLCRPCHKKADAARRKGKTARAAR